MYEDMKLTNLSVYRSSYDKDAPLKTTVQFGSAYQEVKLNLSEELGRQILRLCMDHVVEAIRQSAANALAVLQEEAPELPAPEAPPSPEDNDEIPF